MHWPHWQLRIINEEKPAWAGAIKKKFLSKSAGFLKMGILTGICVEPRGKFEKSMCILASSSLSENLLGYLIKCPP